MSHFLNFTLCCPVLTSSFSIAANLPSFLPANVMLICETSEDPQSLDEYSSTGHLFHEIQPEGGARTCG